MLIVGLTGGMACGKSFVAEALRKLGCYVIEADEVARHIMQPGEEAYAAVVGAFGTGILDAAGKIDRSRLAEIVFGDPEQLQRLNATVHPGVRKRALSEFEQIGDRDPHAVVIYVAAILIESGASREMDKIVVVSCDREQQIQRAMHRPGAVESAVLARLESQMPLKEKLTFADYVVDTSGTKEDALRQIEVVYQDLRKLAS